MTARDGRTVYYSNSNGNYIQPVATDTNGNEITVDTSDSVFTDTLGTTALTLAGSGTPSSPKTFTYTAPSGAQVQYSLIYSTYTIKTNFGCAVSDYGPTAQYLPSELDLPDGSKYLFSYEETPGYSGDYTGRLASITLPTGGAINYTYSGPNDGIECSDGSTSGLTRQTPDGTWTYSRTLNGGAASTTTITDPSTNQTAIDFIGIYPTEEQDNQGSGPPLKTTVICYNGSTPSGSPATCNSDSINLPILQQTVYVQWPSGQQSETNTTYNSYGVATEEDDYDYGSTTPGPLLRKLTTTYASLGNGIVDHPYQITVEDGSGNIAAQTTYTYDQGTVTGTSGTPQHAAVSGSRGNATTISYLVSGSATLNKTFTYYDTGNVQTANDVNQAQTSYTYGACGNSFPTLVNEPLGLSKSMAWNCTGGVETSVTDENGHQSSTAYTDPYFWRPSSTTDQMSNVTNISYSGQNAVESAMDFGSSTTDVLTVLDGLGRPELSQKREAPGSSSFDTVQTFYDRLGRRYKTSLPCVSTAYNGCLGANTSTTFDALSRPTQVTDSGGGTLTYQYIGNDILETVGPAPSGENTKSKQLQYDALGRVTSVCEVTGASGSGSCGQTNSETGYLTTYTYDALGDLTGVSQDFGVQTRYYVYDGLGRMTSETNPESGTTTYTYDTTPSACWSPGDSQPGNLTASQDAAGNLTCDYHDALHRLTTVGVATGPYNWTTGRSVCKRFLYDNTTGVTGSLPNGVTTNNPYGHLVEAETDNCSAWPPTPITDEWFSYDARGETTDLWQSTPHSGGYYHSYGNYWANGLLNQLNSNIGYVTSYTPDGEGRVYSAGAGTELTSTLYNAAGLPTQVNFASGDSDSYSYDPNTNRMTQYKFTVNGQSLTGNLNWNANGTLGSLGITDPFNNSNSQSCSYTHDDLARIAGVNCH